MKTNDITFIGHTYRDRVRYFGKDLEDDGSGAMMYGTLAANRIGLSVDVITIMNPEDKILLRDFEEAGIDLCILPDDTTSEFECVYMNEDRSLREIYQRRVARSFTFEDLPPLCTRWINLAGNADGEYTLAFLEALHSRGFCVSLDMQSFVRQRTGKGDLLENRDVAGKERILSCLDIVKVDFMEAEALTGLSDKKAALKKLGSWGCPEVLLTDSDGVLAYVNDRLLFQPFTNRSTAGRDGRGDTTFAAYVSWRLDHEPEEALAFAAALASIKLETPGPFQGTREEVLARMNG